MRSASLPFVAFAVLIALWGADCSAPELSLPVLEGPQRAGSVQLEISDRGWGVYRVEATAGERQLVTQQQGDRWLVHLPGDLEDGVHELQIRARDRSLSRNEARATLRIELDRTPPQLALAASSREVGQGRSVAILLKSSEELADARVTLTGRDEPLPLKRLDGGLLRALLAVGVQGEVRDRVLHVEAADAAGNRFEHDWTITVTETEFADGGFVQLTPEKERQQLDTSRRDAANAKRREAYAVEVDAELPQTPFRVPIEGRISSPFGKMRRYSSGVVRHHLGTDLAAPAGTPVRASHDGVVTLAELLHIYGNAVILGHGEGVSTSYNHLSRIDVELGQRVRQGDVIGLVGSTGQSTGPHLHWGMVVDGQAVAPEQWSSSTVPLPAPGDFLPTDRGQTPAGSGDSLAVPAP